MTAQKTAQKTARKTPVAQDVAEFYDAVSDLFATVWDDNIHFGYWDTPTDNTTDHTVTEATDRLTAVVTGHLQVGPGDHVLDIGCGLGKPTVSVASTTGAAITGISISAHQITRATQRAHHQGLADRARFQHADAMNLPFGDNTFDAVMALESMPHMPDRGQVLREAARVLRPGGRIVLTDLLQRQPATEHTQAAMDQICAVLQVHSFITATDYTTLITDAGLEHEHLTDITDNIAPAFPLWAKAIDNAQKGFENYLGAEGFQALHAMAHNWSTVTNTAGYLLLTAHHR